MSAPGECDVAIIGGGPAGSLCASLLRRQCPALRVVVIEKEAFPRHHVGEACLPGWGTILERAGVLEAAHRAVRVDKLGFIFNWGPPESRHYWTADFRDEHGVIPMGSWHADRAELDQVLLEHAASSGAEVLQPAKVVRVTPLSGPTPPPMSGDSPGFELRLEQDGETRSLRAARVIDASGQARLLAHQWSLPTRRYDDMNNFAVYGYWRGGGVEEGGAPLRGRERWAVVSSTELGWVWHIPIGETLSSVGLVTTKETLQEIGGERLRETYLAAVRGTDRVGELLERAEYVGARPDGEPERVSAAQDWSYRTEQLCGAGWYTIGDGAVFVDPVLASGLTLASNGASMVANAITTLERDASVDPEKLRASVAATYADLSSAYHRMARVWYRRNTRAEGLHWQARQERLRVLGAGALFEDDADAFTAACLGAINSPLDAALSERSRNIWGTEYFSWISADRLFGRAGEDDGRRSDAEGVHGARALARRALLTRWRRLIDGRVRLRTRWSLADGYHTNRFVDSWQPIRYVEIPLDDPLDPHLRVTCAAFEDCPEGVFPALDGEQRVRPALEALLRPHAIGSRERDARLQAFSETLLQLDMLGLLEVEPSPPPPSLEDHPLLRVVADIALRALDRPARLLLEVDWLGEGVWMRVLTDDGAHWARLFDARGASREGGARSTATTHIRWPREVSPWLDGVVAAMLRRLGKLERGRRAEELRACWDVMRTAPGVGIAFDHTPGQRPVAQPL